MKRTATGPLRFIILLVAGVLAAPAYGQAGAAEQSVSERPTFTHLPGGPKYAPDRVLVRFKRGKSAVAMESAHGAVGAKVLRDYRAIPQLQVVRLSKGMSVAEAVRQYEQNPDVLYAEPDFRVYPDKTPNEVLFNIGWLWGLHNIGYFRGLTATAGADIKASEAWDRSTGSDSVVVGVIDTGVDYNHEDLQANIYNNEAECNGVPGVDNDGNGYINDCHGINAITDSGDPMDDVGHGTHVSGTIGAVGNNNLGVVGVNWNVKIIGCKFMGWDGGYDSDAIKCLNYFALMKDRGVDIVATNNSWGGGEYSQALADAIDVHRQKGILFIAAAGNDGTENDVAPHYPSNYSLPNVISVAATNRYDEVPSWSDWGRYTVHVGAPGDSIISTWPWNGYAMASGTSMATPHVTGVAALLKAEDPTRDWIAIKNLILAGGDSKPSLANTVTQKRLNAYGAMTCSNSAIESQLQPAAPVLTTTVGTPATVAELSINCAAPKSGASITVPVSPSPGGYAVVLKDDGLAPDQAANDGIYTGTVSPPANGTYTLALPSGNSLTAEVLIPYGAPSTPAYSYRTITGNYLSMGDDTTAQIKSPFPIPFGGGSFNTIFVSSNGILSLAKEFDSSGNQALPYANTSTIVAPWWDDLMPQRGTAQNVFWDALGSAPNRELVVEWRDVPHWSDPVDLTATVTFQVVFFESKSDILFNYERTAFGGGSATYDNGALATVGVQVAPGSASQYSYKTANLSDNLALLFQLSGNPLPGIASLSPSRTVVGDPSFTLTVSGTGFYSGSKVRWNGVERPTTFASNTQLTAQIVTADVVTQGAAEVVVFNDVPGGGASAAVSFGIADYAVGTSPSTTSVTAGQAASYTVTVMPSGGIFDRAVSLSCSGLPNLASCSFSPASVTPNGTPITSNLTISTKATTVAMLTPPPGQHDPPLFALWLPLSALGLVVAGSGTKKKKAALSVALALFAILLVLSLVGCGSNATPKPATVTQPGTPAGTYTITVSATAGSVVHTGTVSLVVK